MLPDGVDKKDAIRVLVTGYGPFLGYEVNPSWLAVKELQNVVLQAESASKPVVVDDQQAISEHPLSHKNKPIHISVLKVPVVYQSVLSIVPGLHAKPPVLPPSDDKGLPDGPPPPAEGYDLIVHVGVAGPGLMRIEKLAHKYGYDSPDAELKFAPEIKRMSDETTVGKINVAEYYERARLKYELKRPITEYALRGFGEGYEPFDEELKTDIDGDKLVEYLHSVGVDSVKPSVDAGRYLCDFIYYCSLAESLRPLASQTNERDRKRSKVLFVHCPPVDEPLSTQYVTDALKHIVSWICGQT